LNLLTRAAAVAVLLAARPAAAADVADPAEVFPPTTLAYAEVTNVGEFGPQLAAAVKGTPLEDVAKYVHDRKDKTKDMRDFLGKPEVALLGLFCSPEMLAEAKRFKGVAVAVTGFNDRGEPEVVFAVLTGDSPAAGVAARALLTMSPSLRRVGDAAGVPVYQYREPSIRYNNIGQPELANDKPPTDGPHEATFAYTPGLFLAGTSKATLADVIGRFLGKATAPGSLAGTPAFKSAAALHRKPGVFFYANAAEYCAKSDAANKARGDATDPDLLAWFKLTANPKAVKTLAGSVRFRDGAIVVTVGGAVEPAEKSPLVALFSGSGAKVEWLNHAPRPAVVAVTVPFPEKDRAAAVIGFLDAMAKSTGEVGRLPGEAVKELEKKYKVALAGSGLIARTRAATVVWPAKQELPKGAKPLPVLVLHAEDGAAADGWLAFFPQLVGDLSKVNPLPEPASQAIGGVTVFSLPGTGVPWNGALHYARKGDTVAVGLDRKLVAAALSADPAASVTGGKPFPPPGDGAVAFGALSLGQLLKAVVTAEPKGPTPSVGQPGFIQPGFPGRGPQPDQMREDETKALDEFVKALDALPPAVFVVRRTGKELLVELTIRGPDSTAAGELVSTGLGWFEKWLNRHPLLGGFGNDNIRRRFGDF
jgi:hypothetical protein